MLKIKNLSLNFDNKNIFENINLNIKEKGITLIKGKSGSGKSSLLMCISRVIPETVEGEISGEIIYQDKNIEKLTTRDISGDIAYMFQDSDSQLCTFTVEDEIAFGLENLMVKQELMDGIIDNTLERVGILNLKKRDLNSLSGGEKQKVALASILALNPKIILMDEPTANLDPKSTMEIVSLIKSLRDDFGKTIVIVEHKLKEFIPIVDDVVEFTQSGCFKLDKKDILENISENEYLPKKEDVKSEKECILSVENIEFSYGERNVLKDISFSINKGEIAAVVGCNGAGKSTLSKILMGLYKPNGGNIIINGRKLSSMKTKEIGEKIGLVFQNPEHQFIKMTVEKEMALSLEIRKLQEKTIKEKVNKYLKTFNLQNEANENPFTLSQGQKRRLSTSSMMINGQPILILDEPTYGQDRENLNELIKLLYVVNKSGVTILMITHDMDLVKSCCSKAIYLKDGYIVGSGNPKEILKEYLS